MVAHKVVSHDEWVAARKKHLAKEKEFTHLRDQLSRERRDLPWELVEKDYTFEGERGTVSLQDVFAGRSQLVIYHAMFNPDTAGPQTTWTADAACYRVLVVDGQLQRYHRPLEPPRYDHGGRIVGPVSGDCVVQATDGLDVSLVLIGG